MGGAASRTRRREAGAARPTSLRLRCVRAAWRPAPPSPHPHPPKRTRAPPQVKSASYWEITKYFGVLGWTAFGGPAAHVAMFQKLFVERLHWCTFTVFAELLMLGQCIPGPTSTQMGFAIGVLKKGLSGGLLSGVLFQGPGLLILAILGWAAAKVLDNPPAWLLGLVAGAGAGARGWEGGRAWACTLDWLPARAP